jgi:hypothetical protein
MGTGNFMAAAFGFPTVVLTALLGVVVLYWLLALLGVVDFESSGIDLELQADTEIDDIGTLASYVVAFGLNGVPFSVAVTLLVLTAWTLCCLAAMWLLPLVPTWPLQALAGAAALAASVALALPITARLIRPLRGLFVTHAAISNAALVGQACRVLSQTVSETFGRAEVPRRGASVNISVWAKTPNALSKGAPALILEYDEAKGRYLIEAAPQ